jgi:hypothetical protein
MHGTASRRTGRQNSIEQERGQAACSAFFVKQGLWLKGCPAQRLLTNVYSDYAVARLGSFGVQNPDSKLGGFR